MVVGEWVDEGGERVWAVAAAPFVSHDLSSCCADVVVDMSAVPSLTMRGWSCVTSAKRSCSASACLIAARSFVACSAFRLRIATPSRIRDVSSAITALAS